MKVINRIKVTHEALLWVMIVVVVLVTVLTIKRVAGDGEFQPASEADQAAERLIRQEASEAAEVPTARATPKLPAQILNLNNWYLTLPTGSGSAATVKQAALRAYQSDYFKANETYDAVRFMAPVPGEATESSEHTRSELRETAPDGSLPWGWPAAHGKHVMTATESIDHLPSSKGKLGFAQIHGPGSTWYLILLATGNGDGTAMLSVKDETGQIDKHIIDRRYVLGTKFNLKISAFNGVVTIDYNGVQKVSTASTMADCYFKIGAYNQSDGDFGQTTVYSLAVSHT